MKTHWWNTDRLVEDLVLDRVSEYLSLRYAMISALLIIVPLYGAAWFGGHRGWLLVMEFASACIIALVGLHECFKANGGSNGVDFLKRMYCLSVPVGLKILIVSLVFALAMHFIAPRLFSTASFRDPYFVLQLTTYFLAGMFSVCYYRRIAYHLARAVKLDSTKEVRQ